MVKMTVLASGSGGNSTVVSTEKTRLLVDAGLSCRELMKRMAVAGEDPYALDGIVLTHEHQDHVQGLAVLARKLGVPVYFTEATHRAWMRWMTPQKRVSYADWLAVREAAKQKKDLETLRADSGKRDEADSSSSPQNEDVFCEQMSDDEGKLAKTPEELTQLPGVEYFRAGETFCVGDIEVFPFTIPHDAVDPVGFVFQSQGMRVAIATDLGYMAPNAKAALRKCDVLMIESNHDLEMLRDGPYPWSVKQRVMSRVGHLSNHALAEYLTGEYDGQARYVVLAHLSESNNLPELARLSAERALADQMPLLLNHLLLAGQDAPLESIVL
jgi:phosphoribosyl 1,2-cyclic phosphodiesterase